MPRRGALGTASVGFLNRPLGGSNIRGWLLGGGTVLLCVSVYATDRWLIAASAGHLLFHTNPAEYALCEALLPFLDQPLLRSLLDSQVRTDLFSSITNSVDFIHGTLVLAGLTLMAAVQWFDAELGTWTMRMLSLAVSSTALALWLVVLLRWTRSVGVAIRFALLYTLAPHVFVLIGLVYWGTHEWVCLLHAALLAVLGPFLFAETRPAVTVAVALLAGALTALATLCNFSLLLPAGYLTAYLALTKMLDHRRIHGTKAAAIFALVLVCSVSVAFFVAYTATYLLFDLTELGFEARPDRNSFLEQVFHQPLSWANPAGWSGRVLTWGMLFLPSLQAIGSWRLVEFGVRGLILLAALTLCWRALPGRSDEQPNRMRGSEAAAIGARRSGLFLASYLILGWLAISLLPFAQVNWGDRNVPLSLRYYSHLYPVAFAVLAIWSMSGRRVLRTSLLVAILALGASENLRMMDPGNVGAHRRFDAVCLYLTKPGSDLPALVRFDRASPSFLAGYAYLFQFQDKGYWTFLTPHEVPERSHPQNVYAFVDAHVRTAEDTTEFMRGLGFALSVLSPPRRMHDEWDALRRAKEWDEAIRQGYDLSPDDLESP